VYGSSRLLKTPNSPGNVECVSTLPCKMLDIWPAYTINCCRFVILCYQLYALICFTPVTSLKETYKIMCMHHRSPTTAKKISCSKRLKLTHTDTHDSCRTALIYPQRSTGREYYLDILLATDLFQAFVKCPGNFCFGNDYESAAVRRGCTWNSSASQVWYYTSTVADDQRCSSW